MADRRDPFVPPLHGNAGELVGVAGRSQGVAPNHVLGGVNYGTQGDVRAGVARGQVARADTSQLSRLPVSIVRPIWNRINLLGTSNAEVPQVPVAPPAAPSGAQNHGLGCLDCAQR